MMEIVSITPSEKDKETLCFLKQALNKYQSKGHFFDIDQEVDNNLVLSELSLKALTSFYLLKYEKTHYFNDASILNQIKNKLNMSQRILDIIDKHRCYAKKYYPNSRFGRTGLKSSNPDAEEISGISEELFVYVWKELQSFIKQYREKLGLPNDSVNELLEYYKKKQGDTSNL
jgi:HEPN domain-containing protein